MTVAPDDFAELDELAGAQCEDRLAPEQFARLEELVLGDPAQRLQYIWYMHTHAHAEQANQEREGDGRGVAEQLGCAIEAVAAGKTRDGCGATNGGNQSPFGASADSPRPTDSLASPIALAGATGPFAAFGLPVFQAFLGGVLPAYVLAALLFGAGALVAWMWRADENRQLATTIPLPVTSPLPVQDFNVVGTVKRVCVGNVTGMSNCVWRGSNTLESCCAAGRFELVSGVLELGYSTGVKVLIEGPVTYVINSPNGGCLRVGKVTVRFGETSETQNGKPESARRGEPPLPAGKSHPQTSASGPPLFTIRALNADLASRGAEFTVCGEPSGACFTQVARGSVELTPTFDDPVQQSVPLHEGQSALLGLNAAGEPVLLIGKDASPAMASRQMLRILSSYSVETFSGRKWRREKGNTFGIADSLHGS